MNSKTNSETNSKKLQKLALLLLLPEPGPAGQFSVRATGPVLTSDKKEKHVILPTTVNFAVRRGKIRIYTPQNHPEIF